MRQYTDYGINTTKLWKSYRENSVINDYEIVSLKVFSNVFNHVYNISTRYVLWIILSYTVKIFVYKNNLK